MPERTSLRWLLVLALAGCSLTKPLAPLHIAGATADAAPGSWWKVETPAFDLLSDLPAADTREAAQEIAAELIALGAAFGNPPPRSHLALHVVVLADGADFERYFGRLIWGFTRSTGTDVTVYLWGKPIQWAPRNLATAQTGGQSVLRHELAHVQLTRTFGRQPRWFAEGLAQYLETLRWADSGDAIEVGPINPTALQRYFRYRSVGFSDVLKWDSESVFSDEEALTGSLYGYSWALVFELVNERPQVFGRYLSALAAGTPPSAETLFDNEEPRQIDAKVQQFMSTGRFAKTTVPVALPPTEAKLTLASAEERAQMEAALKSLRPKVE
jgi:hypothetical protein